MGILMSKSDRTYSLGSAILQNRLAYTALVDPMSIVSAYYYCKVTFSYDKIDVSDK